MTHAVPLSNTATVNVPFRIVKHGGCKEMVLPANTPAQRKTGNTIVKALARAFRWKRMLEASEFTTMAELSEREDIAPSYMTHVLRLSLLAPDIVEAILDGRQGTEITLTQLLEPFPASLTEQKDMFSGM